MIKHLILIFFSFSLFAQSDPIVLDGDEKESVDLNDAQKLQNEIVKLGKAVFDGRKKKSDPDKDTRKVNRITTNKANHFSAVKIKPPQPPKPPASPQFEFPKPVQHPQSNRNSNQKTSKDSKKKKTQRVIVRLVFGNNKKIDGWILNLPENGLEIQHKKSGIDYAKEVKYADLKSISIYRWNHKKLRQKKDGILYSFKPVGVRCKLKDNSVLEFPKLPDELLEFTFLHKNYGKAKLYTHFADLQYAQGSWRDRKISLKNSNLIPHPQSVIKIIFLKSNSSP
jgi:hypothetical protein